MDRRRTNPIFNDRKLKLRTFQTNLDCVRRAGLRDIAGVT
jgi:hypothetical protein